MRIRHIVFLLLLMAALHVFASLTGMYDSEIIWIDKILHLMAGMSIGMMAIIIMQKTNQISSAQLPQFMAILGFVLIAALFWEIAEAVFWKILPSYAESLNLYSPNIKDVLTDMAANAVGGTVIGWVSLRK